MIAHVFPNSISEASVSGHVFFLSHAPVNFSCPQFLNCNLFIMNVLWFIKLFLGEGKHENCSLTLVFSVGFVLGKEESEPCASISA